MRPAGSGAGRHPLRGRQEILITSPDPVWLIGVDGLVAWVNPAVEDVLGYAPDELKGTNLFAVVHPDDQETLVEQTNRLLATASPGIREAFHLRYRHARGHWVSLEVEREAVVAGAETSGSIVVTREPAEQLNRRLQGPAPPATRHDADRQEGFVNGP